MREKIGHILVRLGFARTFCTLQTLPTSLDEIYINTYLFLIVSIDF